MRRASKWPLHWGSVPLNSSGKGSEFVEIEWLDISRKNQILAIDCSLVLSVAETPGEEQSQRRLSAGCDQKDGWVVGSHNVENFESGGKDTLKVNKRRKKLY